jgi:hypothetical protein
MTIRAFACLSLAGLGAITLAAISSCDARSEEKTCSFLSISECSSRPYCAVKHARRADEDRQCLAASQPVACTDLKEECDDALSLARDEFDQLFVISNSCVPTSWEAQSDPSGEIVNWPDCE